MSVFKYHAFIYFMRPPPWYGTGSLLHLTQRGLSPNRRKILDIDLHLFPGQEEGRQEEPDPQQGQELQQTFPAVGPPTLSKPLERRKFIAIWSRLFRSRVRTRTSAEIWHFPRFWTENYIPYRFEPAPLTLTFVTVCLLGSHCLT